MNKKAQIAMLAPYRELATITSKLAAKLNFNIVTHVVNQHNVLDIVNGVLKDGIDVVISRGGIAKRIKQENNISVVELKVTGYDLLNAIQGYENKRIAFVEHDTFICGAKHIIPLLGIHAKCYEVHGINDFQNVFQLAVNNGANHIISGSWGISEEENITNLGVGYSLIHTGEESIREALNEANDLLLMTRLEREKRVRLQALLDATQEGIIYLDNSGIIQSINNSGLNILRRSIKEVVDHSLNQVFPNSIGNAFTFEKGMIVDIGSCKLIVNKAPFEYDNEFIGAIITFNEVSHLQKVEAKIRRNLNERGFNAKYSINDIVGESKDTLEMKIISESFAKLDSTVLITGETGTGKEVYAQAIHNASKRSKEAFVAINCSALAKNLLESELFGYVEGAFTGALKGGKMGLFEQAHGGTVFLDEIGELDIQLQASLLRVLQEREIRRIGDERVIPVNVRIIAATNRDLKHESDEMRFRRDLFYRINVLNIHLKPLRKRKEDILPLANLFLYKICNRLECEIPSFDNRIKKLLIDYQWPGNIRELQNIIEKYIVLKQTKLHNDSQFEMIECQLTSEKTSSTNDLLEEVVNLHILNILKREDFNKTKAASLLGINRTTLNRKLKTMQNES